MVAANSSLLEAQLEERPLAKQQEALLDADASAESSTSDGNTQAGSAIDKAQDKPGQGDKPTPKALLKNDDVELQRVSNVGLLFLLFICQALKRSFEQILETVHSRFFNAYNSSSKKPTSKSSVNKPKLRDPKLYDVTVRPSCFMPCP